MIKTLRRASDVERGDCVVLDGIRHIVTRAEVTPKHISLHFEGYKKTHNVTRAKYLMIEEAPQGYKFAFQLLTQDIVFIDDGGEFTKAFTIKEKTRKGDSVILEVYEMARRLTVPADQQLELYNGIFVRDKPIQEWKKQQAWAEYRASSMRRC